MCWTWWRQRPYRRYVIGTAVACGGAAILAHAIATWLKLPRPFMIGLSPAYIEHGSRGSLSSTHAAVMFTVAMLFLFRPSLRRMGAVLFFVAVATGWARVYVGVHFPVDIVAGLLLAIVYATLIWSGARLLTHIYRVINL
ncbi:phosphatase PAP2 family protein [Variovorax sp. RHLX14]|uniref:phosphatase PAP2 family protein n=1 Tax=Variovorax sp. RHLX14 TaxID=1259731 RepID=UPI003F4819BD